MFVAGQAATGVGRYRLQGVRFLLLLVQPQIESVNRKVRSCKCLALADSDVLYSFDGLFGAFLPSNLILRWSWISN